MRYEIDLVHDVALLINERREIINALEIIGKTEFELPEGAVSYTLRSLVCLPGYCCLCGKSAAEIHTPCVSSGGYHAFVGMYDETSLDPLHKAENRSVQVFPIYFEDLPFFLTADNLFPIEQATGMVV